ncbi:MAG TPA: hypothetical protein VIO38_05340, partial [Rariglobus sp.]
SDAAVLVTTFGLTVVFDLVVAVEIGRVLAAILFIRRVAETTEISRVTGDDELETPEQLARGKTIPEGVVYPQRHPPPTAGGDDECRFHREARPAEPPRPLRPGAGTRPPRPGGIRRRPASSGRGTWIKPGPHVS